MKVCVGLCRIAVRIWDKAGAFRGRAVLLEHFPLLTLAVLVENRAEEICRPLAYLWSRLLAKQNLQTPYVLPYDGLTNL
jgi:hypothetical protein